MEFPIKFDTVFGYQDWNKQMLVRVAFLQKQSDLDLC